MKVLQINWEDPGVFALIEVADESKLQDTLQSVDENVLDLIKFENGKVYRAIIDSEEDEDEDKVIYSIDSWEEIK